MDSPIVRLELVLDALMLKDNCLLSHLLHDLILVIVSKLENFDIVCLLSCSTIML
jgi:hypothetical protein